MQATVDSISKSSVIVIGEDKAVHNLTGAAVAALAPTLKLGDVVEFDKVENLSTIKKASKAAAATAAPAVKGSSPAAKPTTMSVEY